jgi:hypothetical protein
VATLQSGLPFSIMDSAAGTLFGPATLYTTGSLAPGATLADAGRSGSVSSRVNEFFNTKAFGLLRIFRMVALLMANIRFPVEGRSSAV